MDSTLKRALVAVARLGGLDHLSQGHPGEVMAAGTVARVLGLKRKSGARLLRALDDAGYVERTTWGCRGQRVRVTLKGVRVLWGEYEAYKAIFDGDGDDA